MTLRPQFFALSRRGRRRGDYNYLGWAIVAGLGALAVVAVAQLGSDGRQKQIASQEYGNLVQLKEKIIKTFGSSFSNLATPSQANFALSGLAPSAMVVGSTVVNGRNGVVSVTGYSTYFTVTSNNVAVDDCNLEANSFSKDSTVTSIQDTTTGTTVLAANFPISGQSLATLCGSASSTMVITFTP